MKFHYEIQAQSGAAETWQKMQDTLALVHCIPGVEEAQSTEVGHYDVTIKTKLGPISLRFKGSADLAIDADKQVMEATVTMSDSRSGNVYGKFSMSLGPGAGGTGSGAGAVGEAGADAGDASGSGATSTSLQIDADVVIAGKLGELAQPLIKRKADQIVREFSENLVAYLQAA